MKRLLSILLLAAFALPLLAPLLALAQDPDINLPACCRRHGQHHCTMLQDARDNSAHRVAAVCPAWPQRAIPATLATAYAASRPSPTFLALNILALPATRLAHRAVTAPERLHPKRGPPGNSPAIA